ncbi:hypothetical protein GLA29479_1103 [Lysobacter antibioticus]|nr:hypothetical protein GLA29479_1103 [Lysobacter antibioticus]
MPLTIPEAVWDSVAVGRGFGSFFDRSGRAMRCRIGRPDLRGGERPRYRSFSGRGSRRSYPRAATLRILSLSLSLSLSLPLLCVAEHSRRQ